MTRFVGRGSLTQVELAERLRASVTTISNWEREVTKPALEDIDPLCVALSLSPDVLLLKLGVTLTPPAAAKLPRELVLTLLRLSSEDMAIVEQVASALLRPRDR